MFQFGSSTFSDSPFPHTIVDDVLPDEVFRSLSRSYPHCPPASGPTGHTIFRGDAGFDEHMQAEPVWNDLFRRCNSASFLQELTEPFAAEIARSCRVEREKLSFVDHIESRAEKETNRLDDQTLPPEAISVRFDFMEGRKSYARDVHLDHRRRLVTMLVYFDSPSDTTFAGGDLVLTTRTGTEISRVTPKQNRAMIFACSERSWHAVEAVTHCVQPRRFLQISLTSRHDIWPSEAGPKTRSVQTAIRRGRTALRSIAGR